MNIVRYTLFVILVIIFSWPIILQTRLSPWFIWLYPFVIWLFIILMALFLDKNTNAPTAQNKK